MSDTLLVRVGPKGRVVLPIEARRALDIEEGDELVALVRDDEITLLTRDAATARLRRMFRDAGPLVDELIAERRAEAARDARP